jgi:hypothetical protein
VAVAKWSAAGTIGANIAGTTLDGLAASATSAFITYDNSTNRDLYAVVQFDLGSITTGAGASITLRQFVVPTGGTAPDNTGSVGGGDEVTEVLTVGASAKVGNFRIRLAGPYSLRFCVTNNTTVAFAGWQFAQVHHEQRRCVVNAARDRRLRRGSVAGASLDT